MKIISKDKSEGALELAKMTCNSDLKVPDGAVLVGLVTIESGPCQPHGALMLFEYQNNDYAYRVNSFSEYDEFILLF